MAITPADIDSVHFDDVKHGYDMQQVDDFLDQMSSEVDAMLQKIADLKGRLTASEQQAQAANEQIEQLQAQLADASAQASHDVAPLMSTSSAASSSALEATEKQISQVLIVAQQSADKIVTDAKETADHIRDEADQKAREVIRQALAEKQNELDEIDRLKQSREEFCNEYKSLLQHFMDDAESAFPHDVLSGAKRDTQAAAQMPEPQPAQNSPYTTYPSAAGIDFDELD